jgi:8-oxo-dGTP diphosphatase
LEKSSLQNSYCEIKSVTAAIIIKGDSILITRRGPGEKLSGYWEFPGGKIEEGESPQECLERELYEELGVTSKAGKIVAESSYIYEHGAFRIIAILSTIKKDNFTLKSHDKAEWISIDSLLNYKLAPADIPIAKIVMEKKNEF